MDVTIRDNVTREIEARLDKLIEANMAMERETEGIVGDGAMRKQLKDAREEREEWTRGRHRLGEDRHARGTRLGSKISA
jgi:hypothetical protein